MKGENLYMVERILKHRRRGKGYQLLTLLLGGTEKHTYWYPIRYSNKSDGTTTHAFIEHIKEFKHLPKLW